MASDHAFYLSGPQHVHLQNEVFDRVLFSPATLFWADGRPRAYVLELKEMLCWLRTSLFLRISGDPTLKCFERGFVIFNGCSVFSGLN